MSLEETSSYQRALSSAYPWIRSPLVASAPMYPVALAPLAVAASRAGGLGFLAGGYGDLSDLESNLEAAQRLIKESGPVVDKDVLPIGVGFITWSADLAASLRALKKYVPCAVWLFAPEKLPDDLIPWAEQIRAATAGKTDIWVQVGSVAEALAVAGALRPDVLVIEGSDAGGHGLARSASVVTLVPEVHDALRESGLGHIPLLAAGGIIDGRGLAAALMLGASGVVMGTRFLASHEVSIARGYQSEILHASDGGVHTVRSRVYDQVRGIDGWPPRYNGRGVINETYADAMERGMAMDENRRLYERATTEGDTGWGPKGRMTTYAGTGVGLIKDVMTAKEIIDNTLREAYERLKSLRGEP